MSLAEQGLQAELATALAMHQQGNLHEAEKRYRDILRQTPQCAEALHLLGLVSHQQHRPEEAINLIRQAIKAKGPDPLFLNNLGEVLHHGGRDAEAIECYREALQLDPDFEEAKLGLAQVLGTVSGQGPSAAAAVSVPDTDVYIVGPAYSGSTLLGNALNGHPSIAHAGEIARLPFFDQFNNPHRECTVCARGKAFGQALECPVWTDGLRDRMSRLEPSEALAAYRQAVGVPVIVDGSKDLDWLRRVFPEGRLSTRGRRARVILSVRHPYAFAATCRRRTNLAIWQTANLWRDTVFDALRTLSRIAIPYMIVRYEEFALAPEESLRSISDFIGVPYDERMMNFWEKPVHAIGGNYGAFVWYPHARRFVETGGYEVEADREVAKSYEQRAFGGWVDDKWRDKLTDADLEQILMTPMLVDTAALVGYDASQFRTPLRQS